MSQSFRFRITDEESGMRLDEFLASRFGSLSRMRIANLISAGDCLLNQKTAQAGCRVATGDAIEFKLEGDAPTAMKAEPVPLEIVYEDRHIAVVVKPAGLLVHPTKNVKDGTLANALAYHLNKDFFESSETRSAAHGEAHSLVRPGIVHRLDRATSGLMVIAKTARALSTLSRHFHRRLVSKRYLALVENAINEEAGTIIAPIGRGEDGPPHWRVTDSGKHAETRFVVRERFERMTLVELEPVTGRTNQLRIHCAYSGHPILGDDLYGSRGRGSGAGGRAVRINEMAESPLTGPRLCLHAWKLAFHHPADGEWLEFISPPPDDFAPPMTTD